MLHSTRPTMKLRWSSFAVLALVLAACATEADDDASTDDVSEDELVATFDRRGSIDLTKTSRILLVGDSHQLGTLPLMSATTKARRYAQLFPNDQIVLFVTKDVREASVAATGSTVVRSEPFGTVAMSDLRRLSADKLVAALDRFTRIASLEFFGHSSPFGALLEADGDGRTLGPKAPGNIGILKDNFARDTNPFVALNGCNGGASVAPELSKIWELPVSGALTGSNFQELYDDGRWYFHDEGFFPAGRRTVPKNDKSFGPGVTPSCSAGACVRMKPQDSPYRGVWADPATGFQYALGFYKFFCDYADPNGTCAKGMATSLYSFPSTKPIDKNASDADVKDVLADFFCSGAADATWFDKCKTGLFAAASATPATSFSSMKSANDYSLECDFAKCEQKLRCAKDAAGNPQKKTCAWVSSSCGANTPAAQCRPKNTTKQTTTRELSKYLEGHRALRGF
jgi:hypothetical protein